MSKVSFGNLGDNPGVEIAMSVGADAVTGYQPDKVSVAEKDLSAIKNRTSKEPEPFGELPEDIFAFFMSPSVFQCLKACGRDEAEHHST